MAFGNNLRYVRPSPLDTAKCQVIKTLSYIVTNHLNMTQCTKRMSALCLRSYCIDCIHKNAEIQQNSMRSLRLRCPYTRFYTFESVSKICAVVINMVVTHRGSFQSYECKLNKAVYRVYTRLDICACNKYVEVN